MREFLLIFVIIFTANLAFSQENKGDNEQGYINLSVDEGKAGKKNIYKCYKQYKHAGFINKDERRG